MTMHDIVFISYKEINAEQNWAALNARFPRAKRVHGIKGIHQAHIAAAHMVLSDMFYCVDGDAEIDPGFNFDYHVDTDKQDHVHVFRARNPINDLVYGYGAVKLLPTEDVRRLAQHDFKTDMTTSINRRYKVVHQLSNITAFNTDEFNTWRSAFRECAKLSSRAIPGQVDDETNNRLQVWCTDGIDRLHGQWCIYGALAGRQYGLDHGQDDEKMFLVNDQQWMYEKFMSYGS